VLLLLHADNEQKHTLKLPTAFIRKLENVSAVPEPDASDGLDTIPGSALEVPQVPLEVAINKPPVEAIEVPTTVTVVSTPNTAEKACPVFGPPIVIMPAVDV
jgi:hypothetical protein